MAESDKASKHHKTLQVIGKLSAQAHKALERYESLNTAALRSHVHLLKVSVAKQEARVESDGQGGQNVLRAAAAQEEAAAGVVSLVRGEY